MRKQTKEGATIAKMLDVSTVHIPAALRSSPFDPDAWGSVRVVEHAYGFIVFAPSKDVERTASAWIRPILRAARRAGAMLINFDTDADVVEKWDEFDDEPRAQEP